MAFSASLADRLKKPRPRLLDKRKAAREKLSAWKGVRRVVLARDKGRCRVCDMKAYDVHHLLPRSRGGRDVESNLVSVCRLCHTDIHGHVIKVRWTDEANRAKS